MRLSYDKARPLADGHVLKVVTLRCLLPWPKWRRFGLPFVTLTPKRLLVKIRPKGVNITRPCRDGAAKHLRRRVIVVLLVLVTVSNLTLSKKGSSGPACSSVRGGGYE